MSYPLLSLIQLNISKYCIYVLRILIMYYCSIILLLPYCPVILIPNILSLCSQIRQRRRNATNLRINSCKPRWWGKYSSEHPTEAHLVCMLNSEIKFRELIDSRYTSRDALKHSERGNFGGRSRGF